MKIDLQDILVRTVFNLSKNVLSDAEVKVLEKGLDYAPIQSKINESELMTDSENFCRQMRLNWVFRNEPTPSFSDTPAFKTKSSGNPPKGHPCMEVYLSQVEKELFELCRFTFGLFQLYKRRIDCNKKFGRCSQYNNQNSWQRFLRSSFGEKWLYISFRITIEGWKHIPGR